MRGGELGVSIEWKKLQAMSEKPAQPPWTIESTRKGKGHHTGEKNKSASGNNRQQIPAEE